ncbi:hypothetical protein JW935_04220 [candidate division KSB1 bacterium]|nr:hypothetical protein [candidate division KSB1 bacterium]
MKNRFFICLFYFFYFAPGFTPTGKLYFNEITVEDGLSNNRVRCIAQDHQGFMWFGTYN